jgi:hypothetical protein
MKATWWRRIRAGYFMVAARMSNFFVTFPGGSNGSSRTFCVVDGFTRNQVVNEARLIGRGGVAEGHTVTFSLKGACGVSCLCYSLIPVWIWLTQEFITDLLCVFRFSLRVWRVIAHGWRV